MKRFDLSTRQAKELARGSSLQIALPAQPGAGTDAIAYARRVLPEVRHADIRSAQWGEVWVARRPQTGAVGELLGQIVADDATGDYLTISIVVCLVVLGRGRVTYPVSWPGIILEDRP